MEYNIIYLTSKVILSKKQFESWNDIQELYEDLIKSWLSNHKKNLI
jgi:hypothetical protein